MKINLNHLRIYFFLVLTILFIAGCNNANDSEILTPTEQNTTQIEDINLTQNDERNTTQSTENNILIL